MTIKLKGILKCDTDAQAARVRAALPEHIRLTRAEPGCLSFDVTPSDDPMIWNVAEEFTDAAAFEAHQTRTKASEWAAQTADIARDYKITGLS